MKPLAVITLLFLNVGAIGAAVYIYEPAVCPFVDEAGKYWKMIADGNLEALERIERLKP